MNPDIATAAIAVGRFDYEVWYSCPDYFASLLLDSAKRHSRFLHQFGFARSHSDALEKFSRAAGFPNWHAFHTVVQGLIDAFNPEVHSTRPSGGREPITTLIPAFVFLTKVSLECPPTQAESFGLNKAALQLAKACNIEQQPLLEMIARMNGADSWQMLLSRNAIEAEKPLYEFEVLDDGQGRFLLSDACVFLLQEQSKLFQDFHSRPSHEQMKFVSELEVVLKKRPDFLGGLLAQSEVLRYQPTYERKRARVLADGIRQAEALIPPGFKGKISWLHVANLFYLQLLYASMVHHALADHPVKALGIARKILRLDGQSSTSEREWLPVLLVANRKYREANSACTKMSQDGFSSGDIELVKAICHFANGELQMSAKCLFLGLFIYPPLRHVLRVDFDALAESLKGEKNIRTVTTDPEDMIDKYVVATMFLHDLSDTFYQWMNHPSVPLVEKAVADVFFAFRKKHEVSLLDWVVERDRQAFLLSKTVTGK